MKSRSERKDLTVFPEGVPKTTMNLVTEWLSQGLQLSGRYLPYRYTSDIKILIQPQPADRLEVPSVNHVSAR